MAMSLDGCIAGLHGEDAGLYDLQAAIIALLPGGGSSLLALLT
jgi:hypothetical protein